MVMAGVGIGDGGAVTVGGSLISDLIVPEWIHGESAGFSELARHIILNYHAFIKRTGATLWFQIDLLYRPISQRRVRYGLSELRECHRRQKHLQPMRR
jgi:hypothetical protein